MAMVTFSQSALCLDWTVVWLRVVRRSSNPHTIQRTGPPRNENQRLLHHYTRILQRETERGARAGARSAVAAALDGKGWAGGENGPLVDPSCRTKTETGAIFPFLLLCTSLFPPATC